MPGTAVLSVTKARVYGIDKDCTKTGEDRRLVLCPRAIGPNRNEFNILLNPEDAASPGQTLGFETPPAKLHASGASTL